MSMGTGWSIHFALVSSFLISSVSAQEQKPLAFDVASIRKKELVSGGFMRRGNSTADLRCPPHHCGITGNPFTEEGASLLDFIMDAYSVKRYQVTGLPPWGDSGRDVYDMTATVGGDRPPTIPDI